MADKSKELLDSIMESIDEGKEEKSNAGKKHKLDDPNKLKVSGSALNKKPKVAESSSSKGRSSSVTKSVPSLTPSMPSTSKEGSELVGLDKLTEVMSKGLVNLGETFQKSFEVMGDKLTEQITDYVGSCFEQYDAEEYEENEEVEEDIGEIEEKDKSEESAFLEGIELNCVDLCGPEVSPHLAKLVKKFLMEKMNEAAYTSKDELYPRPKNIESTSVPKVNKPIWDGMRKFTRSNDATLQKVQKDFLKSALPITEVISKLLAAREDPSTLNVDQMVLSLTDSLAFLGAANVEMVNKRKELIKADLPKNMQGLCKEGEFSSSLLFGENLSAKIKDMTEENKVNSKVILQRPFMNRGNARGRSFNMRRGIRGRGRFGPYNREGSSAGRSNYNRGSYNNNNGKSNYRRGSLNKRGLSRQ